MNQYVRSTLGFKTDLQYNLFGPVHPWDSVGDTYREDTGGAKLRRAMAQNPYMHVLTQSGAEQRALHLSGIAMSIERACPQVTTTARATTSMRNTQCGIWIQAASYEIGCTGKATEAAT